MKPNSPQRSHIPLLSCILLLAWVSFSSCGPVKVYPHATPEELLTSMFECIQANDEESFLTLLPSKAESIAAAENFTTHEQNREEQLKEIEETWDEQKKELEGWGRELFAELRAPLVGEMDLANARLEDLNSETREVKNLKRGFAGAKIVSDKVGAIAFGFATQAGPGGNYNLVSSISFFAGTKILEVDYPDTE